MLLKLSKYGQNPFYIVVICIVILTITSFFISISNKKSLKSTASILLLMENQRISNNKTINSFLELDEKNQRDKKNLQVFISEIKEFQVSSSDFTFRLNNIALVQDQLFQRDIRELLELQKRIENNFRSMGRVDYSTLISKYLNHSTAYNLAIINTKQIVLFNRIKSRLSVQEAQKANLVEIFQLVTIILFIGLSIIICFYIIRYFFRKYRKISSELEAAKSDYAHLIEDLESVLIKLDKNGNIINVSPSCFKVLGFHINGIIDKPILNFLDTNSSINLKNYLASQNFTSEFTFTSQFIYKAINYIWVEVRIKPSNSSFEGFEAFLTNITERKKLENSLIESQTKYNAVFDNMFDGFAYYKVLLDENGQTEDYVLLEVNDAFERLTGLQRENVVGKKLTEIFPGIKESRYNWIGKYDKVALNGEIVKSEHYERHINRWHNISAYSPMKGYFVTLFEDITQRKNDETAIKHYVSELQKNKEKIENDAKELAQLNSKLCKSEAELKELNANKDKFFSIIAHDLRTPFNSLIGLSDLLTAQVDQLSTEEIKDYSINIYNSSIKLFNLLENLLKWAGLQSGRIAKTPVPFYIDALIISVTDLYKNNLSDKEINLVLNISQNLKVYADQDMIETVLRNLLSNAIKFTNKKGTISIEMNCNPRFVEILLSDSGVGIDQNVIDKLFKISEHVTSPGTENEKGTGLGLILCKEFIEKNGGTIKVYSEPGKGSRFIFSVPRFGY